jgi:hypothetical protein
VDGEEETIDVGADKGRCKRDTGAISVVPGPATAPGGSRGFARRTRGVFDVVGPPLREYSVLASLENVILGTLHCAARSPDVSESPVSYEYSQIKYKEVKENEIL